MKAHMLAELGEIARIHEELERIDVEDLKESVAEVNTTVDGDVLVARFQREWKRQKLAKDEEIALQYIKCLLRENEELPAVKCEVIQGLKFLFKYQQEPKTVPNDMLQDLKFLYKRHDTWKVSQETLKAQRDVFNAANEIHVAAVECGMDGREQDSQAVTRRAAVSEGVAAGMQNGETLAGARSGGAEQNTANIKIASDNAMRHQGVKQEKDERGYNAMRHQGVKQEKDERGYNAMRHQGVKQEKDESGYDAMKCQGVKQEEDERGYNAMRHQGVKQEKDERGYDAMSHQGVKQEKDEKGDNVMRYQGIKKEKDECGYDVMRHQGVKQEKDEKGDYVMRYQGIKKEKDESGYNAMGHQGVRQEKDRTTNPRTQPLMLTINQATRERRKRAKARRRRQSVCERCQKPIGHLIRRF